MISIGGTACGANNRFQSQQEECILEKTSIWKEVFQTEALGQAQANVRPMISFISYFLNY